MIHYETFCKIHDCYDRQRLTIAQTARTLGLHPETVAKYVRLKQYRRRRGVLRASLPDPYKDQIVRWLESHPYYGARRLAKQLRREGFDAGRLHVATLMHRMGIEAVYPKPRIDNVFIERLWRTVKYEDVYLHAYCDGREAQQRLTAFFGFYNAGRIHQALDYRTPDEVYYSAPAPMLAEAA